MPTLDEGDALEVSVTLNKDFQSVRYGVVVHHRANETVRETQERAENFVLWHAQRLLEELNG